MVAWQYRWNEETRGRWTARLIRRLDTWLNREQGEVNYYLTQMLTGHGQFRSYLHKMGKVADPGCVHCGDLRDDPLHTFFQCKAWEEDRSQLEAGLGDIAPDNIVSCMLRGRDEWSRVASFVETILRRKKAVEEEMNLLTSAD